MTTPTILVTGATGTIGPTLVQQLLTQGYTVRTFNRRPTEQPAPVHPFHGEITDHSALRPALMGVDAVLHLAALLHIEQPSPALLPEYQRINVDGTRTLVEAATEAGVQRLVYFSTVKVYGVARREPVTEVMNPQPTTLYAQTKLAGEQIVLAQQQIEPVVLRLSAIFGPRVRGSWSRLVGAVRRGIFLPVGDMANRRSLTAVEDVAVAAQLALRHPAMTGFIYNLVGYEDPSLHDILQAMYSAAGRTMPPLRLPTSLVGAGVTLGEGLFHRMGRRFPVPREAFEQLIQDEVYSGAKLRGLGFAPQQSLLESWQQAMRGME
jgi:nucleoside-diphosphate-sugar epimerase